MKTHRISTRSGAPRPNSNPMSFHKVSQWLSRSSQFQSRSLGDDVLTYWDSFGVGANGNGDVCHNLHAVAPAARPASKFKPVLTASSGLAATCLAPLCCGGGCQCRGRGCSTLFHFCMEGAMRCDQLSNVLRENLRRLAVHVHQPAVCQGLVEQLGMGKVSNEDDPVPRSLVSGRVVE
jgi:hypothetical protein